MKYLSRLTALLLALMLILPSAAGAETQTLNFTSTHYNRALLEGILALETAQERSDMILRLPRGRIQALMTLYYREYQTAYPDALCSCYAQNSGAGFKPWNSREHLEDCCWYPAPVTRLHAATGVSVTGDLPEGVTLAVSAPKGEQPVYDLGYFDTTTTYPVFRGYDISLLDENGVEFALAEDQYVTITIPDAWTADMHYPAVDVYHVTQTGEVVYMTSRTGEVTLNEDFSASFKTNGFSDYWVTSGSQWVDWFNNGQTHTIYMAPGTTAQIGEYEFAMQLNTSQLNGVATAKIVKMDNGHEMIHITANSDAQPGQTGVVQLKSVSVDWFQDWTTVNIVIRAGSSGGSGDISDYLDKFNNNRYPVFVAVRTDGGQPGEPSIQDGGNYKFFNSNYGDAGWGSFSSNADGIISTTILDHVNFRFTSADGSDTIGLIDPTGKISRQMVTGVDWDKLLQAMANFNSATATDGNSNWENDKDNYIIVPYVIKCQEDTNGRGWHIDCAVSPKSQITLAYDLNIPTGYVVTTNNVGVPNTLYKEPPATFTVGSIGGLLTIQDGNVTRRNAIRVESKDGSKKYVFWFLGWNTKPDGTGEMYQPGSTIGNGTTTLSQDTLLYAMWNTNPALDAGDLLIRKLVNASEGTEIDSEQTFTFTVTVANGLEDAEYRYITYNAQDLAITGRTGAIQSGGTISLAHSEYVILFDLPASNGDDAAANITVTETAVPGYTASWSGGTPSGSTTTVKIEGGRRSEIICTNTAGAKNTTLTIKKTGMAYGESAIFSVDVKQGTTAVNTYTVVVPGSNGSATIIDLPIGATATITEISAWSWAYTPDASSKTHTLADGVNEVTFGNTTTNPPALHDETTRFNTRNGTGVTQSGENNLN